MADGAVWVYALIALSDRPESNTLEAESVVDAALGSPGGRPFLDTIAILP